MYFYWLSSVLLGLAAGEENRISDLCDRMDNFEAGTEPLEFKSNVLSPTVTPPPHLDSFIK